MSAAPPLTLDRLGRFNANGIGRPHDKVRNNRRYRNADSDDDPKAARCRGKRHLNVHAPQTCNQRGNAYDKGNNRQQFHNDVYVIGDDRGVRIHRAR